MPMIKICFLILAIGLLIAGQSKGDRKSTRLNSSHSQISYAVFCLKKKKKKKKNIVLYKNITSIYISTCINAALSSTNYYSAILTCESNVSINYNTTLPLTHRAVII